MDHRKAFLKLRSHQFDNIVEKLYNNSVVEKDDFSLWTLGSLNKELKKYGHKLEKFGSLYCFKKRFSKDVVAMFVLMILAIIGYLAVIFSL